MTANQAKHTIVGARTEKLESKPHFAGLQVSGTPVTLVEGGQVATLVLTATVPVLCSPQVVFFKFKVSSFILFSQDRALGSCCVHLHLALGVAGQEQRCPWGGVLHRVGNSTFLLISILDLDKKRLMTINQTSSLSIVMKSLGYQRHEICGITSTKKGRMLMRYSFSGWSSLLCSQDLPP